MRRRKDESLEEFQMRQMDKTLVVLVKKTASTNPKKNRNKHRERNPQPCYYRPTVDTNKYTNGEHKASLMTKLLTKSNSIKNYGK